MRGAEIDEARALELLRAVGLKAAARALRCGARRIRLLAEARGMELRRPCGRPPRPFDEARALELLRAGASCNRVHLAVGSGNVRQIVRLARANGIAVRRKAGRNAGARLARRAAALRARGLSLEEAAEALGMEGSSRSCVARLLRRHLSDPGTRAAAGLNQKSRLAALRALNRIRPRIFVAHLEDVDSLARIAADPARHWLLTPKELAVARRYGMLSGERRTANNCEGERGR